MAKSKKPVSDPAPEAPHPDHAHAADAPAGHPVVGATPAMAAVGLSFGSVLDYARRAVRLLQEHGDEFLDLVDAGFRAFKALTGRDYATLFNALNDVNRNARTVIDAIRAEFAIAD